MTDKSVGGPPYVGTEGDDEHAIRSDFNAVQRLIAAGMNDFAISRHIGIPRCTVRDWRCRP
jgi:hypothetical protein